MQALENQSDWLPRPAYDSGWVNISQNETLRFTHDVGTTEVLVYVVGNATTYPSMGVHQSFYGSVYGESRGMRWQNLTDTDIDIKRYSNDAYWDQVRIRIWKIVQSQIEIQDAMLGRLTRAFFVVYRIIVHHLLYIK